VKKILSPLRDNPTRFYALIFVLMIVGGICLFFLAEGSLVFLLLLVLGLMILGNLLVIFI